jgi:hypothetical protein
MVDGVTTHGRGAKESRVTMGMRVLRWGCGAVLCGSVISCGGGGGSSFASGGSSSGSGGGTTNGDNVVSVVADAGPLSKDVNTLFTTVTVCVPGSTTNCQTIDHIQVDTASFGLRILSEALTLSLPVQKAANGNSLLECTGFVDGYSWGPIALADVKVSGETAGSVPIQVIGDPKFANVPAQCSSIGPEEDTIAQFGANGILGIGVFAEDCGTNCVSNANNTLYYACTATACVQTAVPLAGQVPNPVTLFAADNNGTIIKLPSVAAQGALNLTGSLIFGVDTQSNNKSGSQAVLTVDPGAGDFTTIFNNQSFASSFIDTGSNGLYFADATLTPCASNNFTGFYCPDSTQNFTATLQGVNGTAATVSFSVTNPQTSATANPTFTVFPGLAGEFPSSTATFDWGLPFYFGRSVYMVVENEVTSVGTGPYIAF